MPTFQARTGSRVASITGPRTPNVIAEQGRGVDPEGHGGHVRAPGLPGEATGQPGVPEVPRQDAERRARDDPIEDEIRREAEHADQQAGEHHEVREIVDGQPEERVDVARRVPAAGSLASGRARESSDRSAGGRDI